MLIVISPNSSNLIFRKYKKSRSLTFAFTEDEASVQNLIRYYLVSKFVRPKKGYALKVPSNLLVNDKFPSLKWLHDEYVKRLELESQIPPQLRVSIYYFRILKFYNHETIILFAGGLSLGCLSLYYFSKLFYNRGLKYIPAGPYGLLRFSFLGPTETLLFCICSELAVYGYFIPREYLVRRKMLSGDYITVSEYYSWFLKKYPYLALPIVNDENFKSAFINFPTISTSTKSWITLIFLGVSSIGKTGFKFLLLTKASRILIKKYKTRRLTVLSQKDEKIIFDIEFFLSCLE